MLSQLLSSKHKSDVVNLFLAHPSRSFSATEIKDAANCPPKQLMETLKALAKMGFLMIHLKDRVKYYQVDKHFALFPELVGLLKKIKRQPADLLSRQLSKLGDCKLIVLTGIFAGRPRVETDLLLVGKVSPKRLVTSLKLAERFAEQKVNYTVFTAQEYEYRKIMNDRFLKNILENNHVVVVDKTRNRSIAKLPTK